VSQSGAAFAFNGITFGFVVERNLGTSIKLWYLICVYVYNNEKIETMNKYSNIFKRLAVITGASLIGLLGFNQNLAAQYYNDPYGDYQEYDDYGYDDYRYNSNDYMAFYSDLAPYGQWFRDPRYGMVWVPRVANGFVPYQTNGYWAMTQYGNTWMSTYAWGWAAFHYGRWTYDPFYGWIWIPGRTWGPAWVSWRYGGGYYGWAPLGPGMHYNMSYGYNPGFNCWTFVPAGNIYNRNGYHRYVRNMNAQNLYNRTNGLNNYNRQNGRNIVVGPTKGDVESAVRKPVKVYNLQEQTTKGSARVSGNNISMYRPDVQRAATATKAVDTRNVKAIDVSSKAANNGGARTPNSNASTPNRNVNDNANRQSVPARNDRNSVQQPANAVPNRNTNRPVNGSVDRTMPAPPKAEPQRNATPTQRVAPAPQAQPQPQRSAPNVDRTTAPQRTSTPAPAPQRTAPSVDRSAAPQRSAPSVDRSSAPLQRTNGGTSGGRR
jgi:hypothetical protein